MKKSQAGFSLIEVLIVAVVIGLLGFTGWYVYRSTNKHSTERVAYGTSTFTEQGPNDAPTGTKPASATILVGTEPKIRAAMKPVKSEGGSIAYYEATATDVKSSGSRIVKTTEGNYKFGLTQNENVICLVQEFGEQGQPYKQNGETRVDYTTKYNLAGSCSKINISKSLVRINIHTIGDGYNSLECLPASDCTDVPFKYD